MRDIANNMQLDLHFAKDSPVSQASCIILMYDVGSARSFREATEEHYPKLK